MPVRVSFRAAAVFLATISACERPHEPKVVLVLVDITASVRSFDPAQRAWQMVVNRLKPGDRIVLATISNSTYLDYKPTLDREIPTLNVVKDNELVYRNRLNDVRNALNDAMKTLVERAADVRPMRTDILGGFLVASQVFAEDRRPRKILALLSDMQEDANDTNLVRMTLEDKSIAHTIKTLSQRGLVPNLAGARVYVAGADAPSLEKFEEIRRFWTAYVAEANGKLDVYGSALFGNDE
jgi:hypothetical protein